MLGYRHNHTAGTLRRANGLSHSIGLIIDDVGNPFFAAIHRGVEEVARARGVVTFAGSSDADPERERELTEGVLARRVDGLILVPTAYDHTHLLRDIQAGIGVVFIDRPPRTIDADCVLTANREGARARRRAPDRARPPADRVRRAGARAVHLRRAAGRLPRGAGARRVCPRSSSATTASRTSSDSVDRGVQRAEPGDDGGAARAAPARAAALDRARGVRRHHAWRARSSRA